MLNLDGHDTGLIKKIKKKIGSSFYLWLLIIPLSKKSSQNDHDSSSLKKML